MPHHYLRGGRVPSPGRPEFPPSPHSLPRASSPIQTPLRTVGRKGAPRPPQSAAAVVGRWGDLGEVGDGEKWGTWGK